MPATNGGRGWELLEPLPVPLPGAEGAPRPTPTPTNSLGDLGRSGLGFPTCKTVLKDTSLPVSRGPVTKLGTALITGGDSRGRAGSRRAADTEAH